MRLYGISEIARACDATRQQVSQWNHRGQLPTPDQVLAVGPVWFDRTIEPWIAMKTEKRPKAVMICDLVGSRKMDPEVLAAAVYQARMAANDVLRKKRPRKSTTFEVTTGDEWEALIGAWDHDGQVLATELVRVWGNVLKGQPFRVGLGLGQFEQPRRETDPRRMAGEPFYAAREAIEAAKVKHVRGFACEYRGGTSVPINVNPDLDAMLGVTL